MDSDFNPLEALFRGMKAEQEDSIDRNVETIFDALERQPLTDLKYGDVLKQKMVGTTYKYEGDEKMRGVFVRYIAPNLNQRYENGRIIKESDIVIAIGIDTRDGSLLMYAADSRFFEKAEAKA